MKHFIYLIILISIIGCDKVKEVEHVNSTDKLEVNTDTILHHLYSKVYISEFGYNGHDYIWFKCDLHPYGGVVHNPDCHCFNKKKINYD
jgi:hypothetical protein